MIRRIYQQVIEEHLGANRQMIFVVGPRQVGKTTTCRAQAREHGESRGG